MLLISSILSLMALYAVAEIVPQEINIQYGNTKILDLMRQLDHAQKAGDKVLAASLSTRLDAARTQGPSSRDHNSFDLFSVQCSLEAYVHGEIYVADLHKPHPQIAWAMDKLDAYWRDDEGNDLPYPGDFDKSEKVFRIIRMDYEELPWAVRRWRGEQIEKKTVGAKLIAVVEGVAFFAPGSMEFILPLFATGKEEKETSECEKQLLDLANYGPDQIYPLEAYGMKEPPADMEGYVKGLQSNDTNAKFLARFLGRSQVGSSLTIKVEAEKRTRKSAQGEGTRQEAKDEL